MAKIITVVTPNGRRQKVECTPDTNFLQVLEDVCRKQGFQPSDYDLKHHNHILDLTMTLRFSNLPNKAMLEMVEVDQKRKETTVTIGLQLEDGERRMADFPPTTTLFELANALAPSEISNLDKPTISYMRQEVVGEIALKEKTLRQLGLIKGRAILRLLNKEEARQANVSSIYRKAVIEVSETIADRVRDQHTSEQSPITATTEPKYTYHQPDIITQFKENLKPNKKKEQQLVLEDEENSSVEVNSGPETPKIANTKNDSNVCRNTTSTHTQESLERRLKIEEEVTFLGNHKAIAFMPDSSTTEVEDLPDDFYDLSVEEVRSLYHELQENRIKLENSPLTSAQQKEEENKKAYQSKKELYKNAVVRIQFPDHIILQGIFAPTNTIEDVLNFIKEHLHEPNRKFHIFTTPLKEELDPKMTLLDAKFVPCIHLHFKWLDNSSTEQPHLKESTYSMKTPPDAASLLASKYRAPSRSSQQTDSDSSSLQRSSKPSTSKSGKTPIWFKK